MSIKKNDPKDVSTVKGIKGGYMFVAPAGTAIPTDIKTPLDGAFVNVGYVSSDGWSESVDIDNSDPVADVNGDNIISPTMTSHTEKIKCKLLSITKESLSLQYGSKNVTEADGIIKVIHNWSNLDNELAIVLELVLKNNRRARKAIPKGSVSGLDEAVMSASEAYGREVEITYTDDEAGAGCYDYFESVTTKTPGK